MARFSSESDSEPVCRWRRNINRLEAERARSVSDHEDGDKLFIFGYLLTPFSQYGIEGAIVIKYHFHHVVLSG
jgi:hypothetical protein